MKIALLDDKDFGLLQIKNALPSEISGEIFYFSTAREFLENSDFFDLLLLDFYLDKDDISSDMIFPQIQPRAKKIIAFSSSSRGNSVLKKCGADFAVEKVWGEKNEKLENCFLEIFSRRGDY